MDFLLNLFKNTNVIIVNIMKSKKNVRNGIIAGFIALLIGGCGPSKRDLTREAIESFFPSSSVNVVYTYEEDSLQVDQRLKDTYDSMEVGNYTTNYLGSLGFEGMYKEARKDSNDYYKQVANFVYKARKSGLADSVKVFREEHRFGVDVFKKEKKERYILDLENLNKLPLPYSEKQYIRLKRNSKSSDTRVRE